MWRHTAACPYNILYGYFMDCAAENTPSGTLGLIGR